MAWFDQQAGRHPRCNQYLGLTVAEVRLQVNDQDLRIIDTRVVETAGGRLFLTSDLRSDRVNVLVQDGMVTAAATF